MPTSRANNFTPVFPAITLPPSIRSPLRAKQETSRVIPTISLPPMIPKSPRAPLTNMQSPTLTPPSLIPPILTPPTLTPPTLTPRVSTQTSSTGAQTASVKSIQGTPSVKSQDQGQIGPPLTKSQEQPQGQIGNYGQVRNQVGHLSTKNQSPATFDQPQSQGMKYGQVGNQPRGNPTSFDYSQGKSQGYPSYSFSNNPIKPPPSVSLPPSIPPPRVASPSILKTPLSPRKSPARVEFGSSQTIMIPPRKDSDAYLVTPPTSVNTIPMIPITEGSGPIKKTGSTSGLYIVGDPEEFFDYFRRFASWDHFLSTIKDESCQWTGDPNISGLILKNRNQTFDISIDNQEIIIQ